MLKTVIILFITLMILLSMVGCSPYQSFSSKLPELDFTFEYPRGWHVGEIGQDKSSLGYWVGFTISSPTTKDEGPIQVSISGSKVAWPSAEQEAQSKINYYLRYDGEAHKFKLLNQDTINLDSVPGHIIEYTLEQASLPKPDWYYFPLRNTCIEIPRDGKVYEIRISSPPNQWVAYEKDIQRLLETFKWK